MGIPFPSRVRTSLCVMLLLFVRALLVFWTHKQTTTGSTEVVAKMDRTARATIHEKAPLREPLQGDYHGKCRGINNTF